MKTLRKSALTIILGISGSLAVMAQGNNLLQDSLPDTWTYQSKYSTTMPSDDKWWTEFDDPMLTKLIREGEKNSFDLSQAYHRIQMAKKNWEMAKSAYYPTVGISAGWTKERGSGMEGKESFKPVPG